MDIDTINAVNAEERAQTLAGAYDHHHDELFSNPPLSHRDMVIALNEGRFVIEGKQSTVEDAELFCTYHMDSKDAWHTLQAIQDDEDVTVAVY